MSRPVIQEDWMPVPGLKFVFASSSGRIHRYHWSHKKWITTVGGKSRGYYALRIENKIWPVHRLVALAFIENKLGLSDVNHKDGIKENNRVSNLEWCSRADNTRHALKMGLTKPPGGEGHGKVILKETQVFEIYDAVVHKGERQHYVGLRYGVKASAVHSIVAGKSWRHLGLRKMVKVNDRYVPRQ